MVATNKKVRYPENLPLKKAVQDSGFRIDHLARKIGCHRVVLSNIINGHYKGTRLVALLKEELSKTQ